ncbi:MAG: tetratricopeptide repeat protein [Gemmatimonadetes bacterium]|nr:tetratricopeptide repeat protein [Gemmatimonadota bacterium]
MLLPTLVSGAAFPLAVGVYRSRGGASRSVGDVYAANTLGAILGSWTAGFLLIRFLGLREGIVFAAMLQVAVSILLLILWRGPGAASSRVQGLALAVVAGVVAFQLPEWNRHELTRGGFAIAAELRRYGLEELAVDKSELAFFEEGITTTVTVRKWGDELTMQMNGVTEASNRGDLATQVLVGALPAILHPDPQDALVIGLGSGLTAAATMRHPGIQTLDCVEISEAVVHAAAFFEEANYGILTDPRVNMIIGDGRNHLQLSGRTFDVIVSQPSNVWVSGTSALMTSEFFGMCRAQLRPGGVFCSWIQGYSLSSEALASVLAAVREHFPKVSLWSAGWGDLVIIAAEEDFSVDLQMILDKAAREPVVRQLLKEADMPDLASLVSRNFLAGAAVDRFIGDVEPNTDDNLFLEFRAPRLLYEETIRELFESLHAAAGGTEEFISNAPEGFAKQLPRLRRARELESRGRLFFREGRGDEGLRYVEEAHTLHPTDPAIADILAKALTSQGATLARRGDPGAALGLYRRAAEIDPEYGEPLVNSARLYLKSGNGPASQAMIAEALRRRPDHPEYLSVRAQIRIRTGEFSGALEDARRALEIDPNSIDGFTSLGLYYKEIGQFDRADSVFAAALARHPGNLELREARDEAKTAGRKAWSTP